MMMIKLTITFLNKVSIDIKGHIFYTELDAEGVSTPIVLTQTNILNIAKTSIRIPHDTTLQKPNSSVETVGVAKMSLATP
jgi:hypothetical protein